MRIYEVYDKNARPDDIAICRCFTEQGARAEVERQAQKGPVVFWRSPPAFYPCSCLTTTEIQATDQALRAAMRAAGAEDDSGCDWLSSRPSKVKFVPVDLIEVCGGSGYYGRPGREWRDEAR